MKEVELMQQTHYFWFGALKDPNEAADEEKMKLWFGFSSEMDEIVKKRYSQTLEDANNGKLDAWQESSQGTVTLIVILDQFSRQIHRKDEKAFSYDAKALAIAEAAVTRGQDKNMHMLEKIFCYMPYQHSEEMAMQEKSVALFESLLSHASKDQYEFATKGLKMAREHKDIISQFGRYPHRNEVLGRVSTEEEIKFLGQQENRYGQ